MKAISMKSSKHFLFTQREITGKPLSATAVYIMDNS